MSPLRGNLDPVLIDEMAQNFDHMATVSMFEGLIDKNRLGNAEQLLNSKEFDKALGVKSIRRLNEMIKTKRRFNKAKVKDWHDLKLKDPHEYLRRVGKSLKPLDFKKFGNQTYIDRTNQINKLNASEGIDLSYLTPADERYIHDKLPTESIDTQVAYTQQFRGVPEIEYRKMLGEIAEKNPGFGMSIALARTNTRDSAEASRQIIRGLKLSFQNKETKGFGINIPKVKELNSIFDIEYGNSIDSAAMREGARESGIPLYLIGEFDAGRAGQEFDPDEYKKGLHKILGEPHEVEVSMFSAATTKILPIRGGEKGAHVDKDYMNDLLDEVTNEQILKTHGDSPRLIDGTIVDLNTAGDRITFQQAGEGKLRMYFMDKLLYTKNYNKKGDNTFILDLYKLDASERTVKSWWQRIKDGAEKALERMEVLDGNKL